MESLFLARKGTLLLSLLGYLGLLCQPTWAVVVPQTSLVLKEKMERSIEMGKIGIPKIQERIQLVFPWKRNIVCTIFWIGEAAGENNPTPNDKSSWDAKWVSNYGGFDNPSIEARNGYTPAHFTPRQNPFYIALPYNDVTQGKTKEEAPKVIPWFKTDFCKQGQSVCKGRWLAIHYKGRVCYAQWEDVGPCRTDHWQYVFGNERPKPNMNNGAGIDISPAVRDYLGLSSHETVDWKFVNANQVPNGPWSKYGQGAIVKNKSQERIVSVAKNMIYPTSRVSPENSKFSKVPSSKEGDREAQNNGKTPLLNIPIEIEPDFSNTESIQS